MSERYVDAVLEGLALWTDIEHHVEQWHASDSGEELHEFLGFSWEEYALWVERPQALRLILAARERGENVSELLVHVDEVALAARGLSAGDAYAVRAWLERTGRLPSS